VSGGLALIKLSPGAGRSTRSTLRVELQGFEIWTRAI